MELTKSEPTYTLLKTFEKLLLTGENANGYKIAPCQ